MLGSSPIVPWTLVASTIWSRRPASALPTITSDSPAEYTSAVSTKLMPASRAACTMRMQSSWSGLPHAPNIMAPRHHSLTLTPVVPKVRMPAHPRSVDELLEALEGDVDVDLVLLEHRDHLGAEQLERAHDRFVGEEAELHVAD